MQISYKMFKNLTITPHFLRSAKLEPLGTSGLGSAIFCCYQGYQSSTKTMSNTHPFNGPFARNTHARKVKPIWILVKQETVSGSGICWAICKSAPRSRQITMPVPYHSVFYRPDALPAAQPTVSKHWWQETMSKATWNLINTRRREFDLPFHGSLITACGGMLYNRRRLWCLSDCYVHRLTQDAKTINKT